ncbi:hypothetical protein TI39_contig477g00011 [Zymoseptoria brevis]|uniref:Uncharacterized protein n=1 Tax=Zymoseptoria brevis TaxID=1047168 RepID=A0A0F4GK24_9PEZI|nr:hypothetical protein TI39_contig477g00011 [Zymoseptoria brevis]
MSDPLNSFEYLAGNQDSAGLGDQPDDPVLEEDNGNNDTGTPIGANDRPHNQLQFQEQQYLAEPTLEQHLPEADLSSPFPNLCALDDDYTKAWNEFMQDPPLAGIDAENNEAEAPQDPATGEGGGAEQADELGREDAVHRSKRPIEDAAEQSAAKRQHWSETPGGVGGVYGQQDISAADSNHHLDITAGWVAAAGLAAPRIEGGQDDESYPHNGEVLSQSKAFDPGFQPSFCRGEEGNTNALDEYPYPSSFSSGDPNAPGWQQQHDLEHNWRAQDDHGFSAKPPVHGFGAQQPFHGFEEQQHVYDFNAEQPVHSFEAQQPFQRFDTQPQVYNSNAALEQTESHAGFPGDDLESTRQGWHTDPSNPNGLPEAFDETCAGAGAEVASSDTLEARMRAALEAELGIGGEGGSIDPQLLQQGYNQSQPQPENSAYISNYHPYPSNQQLPSSSAYLSSSAYPAPANQPYQQSFAPHPTHPTRRPQSPQQNPPFPFSTQQLPPPRRVNRPTHTHNRSTTPATPTMRGNNEGICLDCHKPFRLSTSPGRCKRCGQKYERRTALPPIFILDPEVPTLEAARNVLFPLVEGREVGESWDGVLLSFGMEAEEEHGGMGRKQAEDRAMEWGVQECLAGVNEVCRPPSSATGYGGGGEEEVQEDPSTTPWALNQQKTLNQKAKMLGNSLYSPSHVTARLRALMAEVLNFHASNESHGDQEVEERRVFYPLGGDTLGYGEDLSLGFRERVGVMREVLRRDKRVVMDVLEGRGVRGFVGAPWSYHKRKDSNNGCNEKKKTMAQIAREEVERREGEAGIEKPARKTRAKGKGRRKESMLSVVRNVEDADDDADGEFGVGPARMTRPTRGGTRRRRGLRSSLGGRGGMESGGGEEDDDGDDELGEYRRFF